MAQPTYPWPDLQHELGGGRVYYLTRKYWESTARDYLAGNYGIRIEREVSAELLEKNRTIRFPQTPEPESGRPEPPAPEPASSPSPETVAPPSPEALPPLPGA